MGDPLVSNRQPHVILDSNQWRATSVDQIQLETIRTLQSLPLILDSLQLFKDFRGPARV